MLMASCKPRCGRLKLTTLLWAVQYNVSRQMRPTVANGCAFNIIEEQSISFHKKSFVFSRWSWQMEGQQDSQSSEQHVDGEFSAYSNCPTCTPDLCIPLPGASSCLSSSSKQSREAGGRSYPIFVQAVDWGDDSEAGHGQHGSVDCAVEVQVVVDSAVKVGWTCSAACVGHDSCMWEAWHVSCSCYKKLYDLLWVYGTHACGAACDSSCCAACIWYTPMLLLLLLAATSYMQHRHRLQQQLHLLKSHQDAAEQASVRAAGP